MFRTTYVHGPEAQIRNDPATPKWVDSPRNVVQVFNSDKSTLYATILTIAAERQKITEKTAMTFAERGTMQPETIVTWFYAGRDLGHQFVYSEPERLELARAKLQTVTVG